MSRHYESREELLEKIKSQACTDSVLQSQKKRFGLFSFKTPVAICDTIPEKPLHPRDENGKVISKPKNVTTTIVKSGKVKSAYFSVPNFVTIGDKYQDPGKLDKQQQLLLQSNRLTKDQAPFKPQNSYQNIYGKSSYKHETDFIEEQKQAKIDSENKVIIGPYNIVTGPYRAHIKYPHLKDEYSRLHERQLKAFEEHKLRMKDKPSFKTWDSGNKLFNTNRQIYDISGVPPKKVKPRALSATYTKHEQAFKPSHPGKFGYNRTMNKFPKYIENPIFSQRRRSEDTKSKEPFKLNHALVLTGPTPTITCNPVNLRRSIRPSTAISFQH